jgi:hypothetical protein
MVKVQVHALDVPSKLQKIFSTNDKFLILSAVQNFRMILNIDEDEVLKLCIPFLDTMTEYFEKTCLNKNNAIHSAILEIYAIISRPEYELLINHMVTISCCINSKVEHHPVFLELPEVELVAKKIKERHIQITTGAMPVDYSKLSIFDFTRRGRPNLTIISPFGSVITQDSTKIKSPQQPQSNGNSMEANSASGVKRTSNAMQMDYDDEMSFNMDTKGKEAGNFMIEGRIL